MKGPTLHLAAERGDPGLMDLLLADLEDEESAVKSALVNSWDEIGWSPLDCAAYMGAHPQVIESLVKAGANVNGKDSAGNTPLMKAAAQGHHKVVEVS